MADKTFNIPHLDPPGDQRLLARAWRANFREIEAWINAYVALRSELIDDHGDLSGLGDDDHPQYHNESRANTWFATKTLDDISDVNASSPTVADVLVWMGSTWTNVSPSSPNLDDLADVSVPTPADGEVLAWDSSGSLWVAVPAGAASSHTHTESDITDLDHYTDTDADARIAAASIGDLSDVSTGTPTDGQALTWDSSTSLWVPATLAAGVTDLPDLGDVTITAVADNEILGYESTGSTWVNRTLAEAGIAAASHTHTESSITDLGSYLENVVEDLTPQLGGNLDGNNKEITNLNALYTSQLYEESSGAGMALIGNGDLSISMDAYMLNNSMYDVWTLEVNNELQFPDTGSTPTQRFDVYQLATGDGQLVIEGATNGAMFVLEEDGGLGWVTPSLSNSWTDFGSGYQGARYCKDALGWVHVEGLVKDGSPDTATIFTLPAGYRPAGSLIFASWNASGAARITVGSDGQVSCNTGGGSSFQGINCSFYVGF